MLVNFTALCRDIKAMGPKSTQAEVEAYALSQRTFLEKVAEIICFNYRSVSFSVSDIQESVKQDLAGWSAKDMMLISRCVKLMADKTVTRYRYCDLLASRYYRRERFGRYVR